MAAIKPVFICLHSLHFNRELNHEKKVHGFCAGIGHGTEQRSALPICPGQAGDLSAEAVSLPVHPVGALAGKLDPGAARQCNPGFRDDLFSRHVWRGYRVFGGSCPGLCLGRRRRHEAERGARFRNARRRSRCRRGRLLCAGDRFARRLDPVGIRVGADRVETGIADGDGTIPIDVEFRSDFVGYPVSQIVAGDTPIGLGDGLADGEKPPAEQEVEGQDANREGDPVALPETTLQHLRITLGQTVQFGCVDHRHGNLT